MSIMPNSRIIGGMTDFELFLIHLAVGTIVILGTYIGAAYVGWKLGK